MNIPLENQCLINEGFYAFINNEVLPLCGLNKSKFWNDFNNLVKDLAPQNRELLKTRAVIQEKIDHWHLDHRDGAFDPKAYKTFLQEIGYLLEEGPDFTVTTSNVDEEIATIAGPQLVVPVKNARFALNAANARWGSLYDALYGTDVIPFTGGLKPCKKKLNEARAKHVIEYAKSFLDEIFPLEKGSHHDVISYVVFYQHLLAFFPDGTECGLKTPGQFVALTGHKSEPESILLCNNGLHVEIQFDRSGSNGSKDLANIQDIILESAVTTIMDCEDSVAAVDAEDKVDVYRNWLGLISGDLKETFRKGGETVTRRLNQDRIFTSKDGDDYILPGRALMLIRNVGHLMETDLMQDHLGNFAPEGIIDAVITSLIGSLDLQGDQPLKNSRTGSIYIVKPKMHGPEEVAFTCKLFARVEDMLDLPRNTLKLGIMDEERRTTVNLKECIRVAKERVVFINTGFLDRTGDEIHTSMQAGPFLPKEKIKAQPWIKAYENWNVDIGLECGLQGRAQIGKGMWPMPDEMNSMMKTKLMHPASGANTAWVPSPTAAVLHAMHYHKLDVTFVQNTLKTRARANLSDILRIPLLEDRNDVTPEEIQRELENNIQGILGYVVRWIDMGIGCSKVPDINNVGLMEDRATLRISSQHIANWLCHGICTKAQVLEIMASMAKIVDEQNAATEGYIPMEADIENSIAFKAAKDLIFEGEQLPSGYTEPVLHKYRVEVKQR